MASIRSMLGTIEGSAGGITFASRGGLNIMRQKVGSNSSNSPAQQVQRKRFGSIGTLAKNLGSILLAGYKTVGGATPYNRFVGQNFAATSLNSSQMPVIDFSKISISTGGVTVLTGLAVAGSATGQTVSWTNNSNGNQALATDKVYVAIVDIATGEVYESQGLKKRPDGSVVIADAALIGKAASALAVYAFATRADNSDASPTTRLAAPLAGGGGGGAPVTQFSASVTGPTGVASNTTITSAGAEKLEFDELTSGTSGPYNMVISVAGNQVASVDTFDRYAGKPFRFTEVGGAVHTGTFAPTVNF